MNTTGLTPDWEDHTSFFAALEAELKSSKTHGLDIQSWSNQIYLDFVPFFENPENLEKAISIGGLTFEHSFWVKNSSETWFSQLIHTQIHEYREARDSLSEHFFPYWEKMVELKERSIHNTGIVAQLQNDLSSLSSVLSVKSLMRDLNDLLEGSLQPLVRLRLSVWSSIGKRKPSAIDVKSMSFGAVIEELALDGVIGHAYRPEPLKISVSQWRNLASHNDFKVQGDALHVTYGTASRRHSLSLSINEFISVVKYCNALVYAHKIALELFDIDNIHKLHLNYPTIDDDIDLNYSFKSTLAFGLVASGFTVNRVESRGEEWKFCLTDNQQRSFSEVTLGLQRSVCQFLLYKKSLHIIAEVISGASTFNISFLAYLPHQSDI